MGAKGSPLILQLGAVLSFASLRAAVNKQLPPQLWLPQNADAAQPMHDTRMRSPRNTEEEEVFLEKAAAGPKDHVMLERKSAAEMIKAGIFFVVFFAASCGFTASQELIVSTPGFKPLHRGFLTLCHSASYLSLIHV